MSKQRSDAYRMRRAVNEASNHHDGAYNCEMAMKMIAEQYNVDLARLTKLTMERVEDDLRVINYSGEY